jgi:predicted  nucleic acid-binding Zn-ribbon protein
MSVDLRGLLLRLLREDEEFRLAVMGLLGYSDVKSSVDRLVEAVGELTKAVKSHDERLTRLENAVEELTKAVKAHEERLTRLENAVEELTKAIKAHEERLTKVEDRLTRLENAVEELTKAVRSHEDRLTKVEDRLTRLENAVEELTKAVRSHEERLAKVEERLTKVEDRLTRLERAVEELTKAVRSHEERLTRIERKMVNVERRLSRIERTLDNITISLEDEANYMVQYLLKQRGIVVKTSGIFFDSKYEFDIYGGDGDVTVIGEVKSRASPRTVQRLVNKVRRVMGKWPERFKGRVIIVLYCLRALPGTVEEAGRQGVWLMEDLEEKTKPNI